VPSLPSIDLLSTPYTTSLASRVTALQAIIVTGLTALMLTISGGSAKTMAKKQNRT
jgi:hypothetical protein